MHLRILQLIQVICAAEQLQCMLLGSARNTRLEGKYKIVK
jgi:hypothetical protein